MDLRTLFVWVGIGFLTACAGSPSQTPPPPCQGYCSTHGDGYQWAQSGNFTDLRFCQGYDDAFVQGCLDGLGDARRYTPASQGI